ncbi:MAG TPA: zinc-dependent metalloprotease family protein [Kofleriaceae bacterium]|nr:zinc-dependent metalloprotease family protein [Kofleriaceae bacterium]
MRATWLWLVVVGACGAPASSDTVTFDPCAPLALDSSGATIEQAASIDDAIAMWRAQGVDQLAHAPGGDLAVVFRDAASSIYGFYDDANATVYVNSRLSDAEQRAITVAHEVGHALGLVHVDAADRASVMNPGNLAIAPTAEDEQALARLWGSCR